MVSTVLAPSSYVILEEKANSEKGDNAIKSPTLDLFGMRQLTFFPGKLNLFVVANTNGGVPEGRCFREGIQRARGPFRLQMKTGELPQGCLA